MSTTIAYRIHDAIDLQQDIKPSCCFDPALASLRALHTYRSHPQKICNNNHDSVPLGVSTACTTLLWPDVILAPVSCAQRRRPPPRLRTTWEAQHGGNAVSAWWIWFHVKIQRGVPVPVRSRSRSVASARRVDRPSLHTDPSCTEYVSTSDTSVSAPLRRIDLRESPGGKRGGGGAEI